MGLLGHRCFPLKCCCWVVAMLIALRTSTSSQEFCTKQEGKSCEPTNLLYLKGGSLVGKYIVFVIAKRF